MKEILKQYAAYNVWANQRMVDTILILPKEKQTQPVVSSFAGLHLTLLHMWEAESIWWQRIKLSEVIDKPKVSHDDVPAICEGLMSQSMQWNEWVNKSTEAALDHTFTYRNSKTEQFKQPVWQVLVHMFNHQSYHREQLVTLLRQMGISAIPATDFIEFSRNKK